MPTVDSMRPKQMAMAPFRRLPSDRVMVATRANIISENISGGPNFRAALAIGWVRKMRNTMPIMPPMKEAMAEMASAAPALPCLVIGNPSKQETMAEASPGVLIMMEARDPPNMAP